MLAGQGVQSHWMEIKVAFKGHFLILLKREKMNKAELVKRVAEKLEGVPQKIAAKAVDAVFESIQEGLEEDGIVKIGQWGTYSVDDM